MIIFVWDKAKYPKSCLCFDYYGTSYFISPYGFSQHQLSYPGIIVL